MVAASHTRPPAASHSSASRSVAPAFFFAVATSRMHPCGACGCCPGPPCREAGRGASFRKNGGEACSQLETIDMREQILAIKNAFAFLRAQIAAREQAAEPPPGGAVARISENVRRAVGEDEPRAGMIGERQLLFALDEMGAHHARDRIAVAQAETIKPDMRGLQHQLLGMRS